MSLEVTGISTAIRQLRLTQKSRNLSEFSKPKGRLAIHLWQSLKAGGAEQHQCIASYVRHSTERSLQVSALSVTLTARGIITFRGTSLGGHMPKMKPTKRDTAGRQVVNGTGKRSYQKKPFALSGHPFHSACGMRLTLQRSLASVGLRSVALRQESATGEASSNSLHGPGAWEANPWVAAITFRPVLGNIDQIGEAA